MGQRGTVEKLNEKQLDFVIKALLDNENDREISLRFKQTFKKNLPKSSLHSWRKRAGDELIDRYRMARFQAKQLRDNLSLEDKDDYQNIIKNIEERLLTATRDVIHESPTKLLLARQREENFRLKREQLALKAKELAFEREKFERTQNTSSDRFAIGSDVWKFILSYFLRKDPTMADGLTNHSETLLEELGEHLEQIQTS